MIALSALSAAAQESQGGAASTPDAVSVAPAVAAVAAASASASASGSESRKATKAADRKLRKQVAGVLARTKRLDSSRLLIFAKSGVVTLSGEVADAEQAALAVSAAQRVPGVGEVRNRLRISPQTR
ncbi:BON domain-containing protein [Burkholderia cepacia]|nr:BON domain-containing protein [Burkholderia cepacia]MBY4736374.1 BON domain-containing protein [Burkholderia cepacia]MBY4745545.1 BON domain-containing protein [Burkholderia cepacia]MBY4760332.1 BON domain-containing protein [Burkholderia cepacia]MBY4777248.1 BON domain-containing protein [Burkholderia cepacia]